jgi:hypothetical protein
VNWVALAAVLGSTLVGLASVWASVSQRKHDRELVRGKRLFDRRTSVYEEMFLVLYQWRDNIDQAADAAEKGNGAKKYDSPGRTEWVLMRAKLRSGGSRDVGDAYTRLVEAVRSFYDDNITTVRDIRKHGGGSLNEALGAMKKEQDHVKSRTEELEELVCSELETLYAPARRLRFRSLHRGRAS